MVQVKAKDSSNPTVPDLKNGFTGHFAGTTRAKRGH
jgi:hypothetical protein